MVVWVIEKLGMTEIQESDTVKKNWIHGMRNPSMVWAVRTVQPHTLVSVHQADSDHLMKRNDL